MEEVGAENTKSQNCLSKCKALKLFFDVVNIFKKLIQKSIFLLKRKFEHS